MLKSGKNVGAESAIPHMVITSTEGEDEEVKVGDVNGVSVVQELIQNGSEVERKPEEDVDRQSTMQRPLIISSSGTSKTDIPSSTDETSSHVQESSTQSADQRPLLISGGSSATPAKPIESIYEVIEPKNRIPEQVNGVSDALSDTEASKHDGKSLLRKKEDKRNTATPEIPKDSDGFFAKSKAFFKDDIKPHFSFPKFSFGGKEQKKALKDVTSSGEQSSLKLEREDRRAEKTQEYSIEAAEASSYIDHAMEHYRKIDADATIPLPYSTTESATMSSDASKSFDSPSASSRSPVSKSDNQPLKTELPPLKSSTQIMSATAAAESGKIQLAPEEPCELFVKESKTPKSTLTKKQSKDGKKVGTGKRASTPESLYDTCCIRLAVLLRNKALEIATDKAMPPKKPPKPSAEAVAKARAEIASKKLKEYECQPHSFGDDFHVGFDELRYADEDTESSTDYKDLENLGVVANPECYGIIRKMKDEKSNEFRAPSSTCSGMSSYYTADTVTLKDENSSDNTLETVSLGSYESVVSKPQFEQPSFSSSSSYFISSKEKLPTSQPTTLKKVPPPVPPKPAVLPDAYKGLKTFSESRSSDLSRCVNTLSLSPRPVLRSTGSPGGIKKRPLTIAGIKETDFSDYSKNKTFSTLPHKPVLNTVVRNTSLKTMRNLPAEPMKSRTMKPLGVSKSLPLEYSSGDADSTHVSVPKSLPPPRPPPPTVTSSSLAAVLTNTPVVSDELVCTEEVIPPPRRGLLKHHVSPPRPIPPAKKPALAAKPVLTPPPRPPPPIPRSYVPPSPNNIPDNFTVVDGPTTVVFNEDQKISSIDDVQSIEIVSETKLEPKIVGETSASNEESCEFKHPSELFISSSVQSNEKSELESKSFEESNIVSRHSPVACDGSTKDNLKKMDSVEQPALLPPPRLKIPRPPPRGRRKRSRTVEVVSVTKEVPETRKRSQSLTDIDIEKRVAALETPAPEKPDLKSLYTTVNKDPFRTKNSLLDIDVDHGRRSPSTDSMSGRPLPPPPPPPRLKSHSAGRRSKSDERPSSSATYLSSSTSSITKAESMPSEINGESPSIKPPVRKNKESKKLFFSLRGKGKEKKVDADKKFHTVEKVKHVSSDGYNIPIKPGRRVKPPPPQPVIQYDENANVAIAAPDPTITANAETNPPPLPARQRGVSMNCDKASPTEFDGVVKLQRSLSEGPSKKSHSNWYDKIDTSDSVVPEKDMPVYTRTDSWDMVDWSPDKNTKTPSPENLNLKRDPPPRTKKMRQTSKFYVNVDEKEEEEEELQQQPICAGTPSLPPMEDKETSPLRLDCSEKSVQTSLETLSVGIASHGEMSDDTDDLLDLAQTLQNELKSIITRHKDDKNQSGEDSAGVSEHSGLAYDSGSEKKPSSLKIDLLPNSSTSSASEIWQMSSSDDSEVECPGGEGSNVSEAYQAKKKKKIFYIAQEIMTSERAFVDALKLLNVDFRTFVNEAGKQKGTAVVPDDILNQILNHLPQLQHLNENLLMELEDRIEHWDKTNKIADVIVKMGPFLKLYSWYIQDFEATISLLEETKKKHPLFGQVTKEFELSSRCKRLSLNHYMLKPVQRIPQYRLLLQEYLHHLSEDCEDYEQTKEALRIVSEVANHANESMKHGDNFQKLISIQSSILGHKEIIKPGRMFIKEGELMKLSRRGMQPRWFVLLNDMLLYLTQVQQGLYRVNHELMLAGMKVAIPIQPDYQNEFSIISVTRSFTLAAKSQEERQEWIVALTKAIEENASKRSTFTAVRLHQNAQKATENVEESFVLGRQAPVWIPDTRVTMCQLCTSEFTVTFRRHHCRACGKVICSICSSNRISLPYLGNRIARVCDECHIKLGQGSSACTESGETDSDNQQIAVKSHLRTDHWHNRKQKRNLPSVLKEVCANDQGSTISGYMYKRINKNWKRNWFVVKDKVLYEYKASEDVAALRSIPLLGFQINTFSEPLEGIDSSLLIELTHPGQPPITFHAETPGAAERWIKALREATVLE